LLLLGLLLVLDGAGIEESAESLLTLKGIWPTSHDHFLLFIFLGLTLLVGVTGVTALVLVLPIR
jgi:hypothetical protein